MTGSVIPPIVDVSHLHKVYRDTEAVRDLSFQVNEGQILGLVGRNGAGKTTTLRSLAGVIAPTFGELRIGGHDIQREPLEAKRKFSLIPDEPALFDMLTVWEHLEFVAAAYRVDNLESIARYWLERFELTDKVHSTARELSRGMRQKVGVCCALVHDPQVLFFDEPLTGLDPRAIRTLKDCIREQSEQGRAIIISSHLLSLVEDMCTDLLILEQGATRYFGPLDLLRSAFPDAGPDATLEDVFFYATEGTLPGTLSEQEA